MVKFLKFLFNEFILVSVLCSSVFTLLYCVVVVGEEDSTFVLPLSCATILIRVLWKCCRDSMYVFLHDRLIDC